MVGHYNRPDPKLRGYIYRYFAKLITFWLVIGGVIYYATNAWGAHIPVNRERAVDVSKIKAEAGRELRICLLLHATLCQNQIERVRLLNGNRS